MKKNIELSKLRLTSELKEKMENAIKIINANPLIEINQQEFRRMAIKHFSEAILLEGLTINIKPKSK